MPISGCELGHKCVVVSIASISQGKNWQETKGITGRRNRAEPFIVEAGIRRRGKIGFIVPNVLQLCCSASCELMRDRETHLAGEGIAEVIRIDSA